MRLRNPSFQTRFATCYSLGDCNKRKKQSVISGGMSLIVDGELNVVVYVVFEEHAYVHTLTEATKHAGSYLILHPPETPD